MLTVSIICVGKLKEKYWSNACDEYLKRMKAFCKCSVIEVDEKKMPENPSDAQIRAVVEEEGKRIISRINSGSHIISLCIEGKQKSSEDFSSYIDKLTVSGTSHISFIIGGSWGLSEEVKRIAGLKLSMSEMTFPHQMARVMLLEQIYRAFQISSSGKYHK